MRTTDPGDAARIELLLAELRLPAIKLVWASLAAQADKEGRPDASWQHWPNMRLPSAADPTDQDGMGRAARGWHHRRWKEAMEHANAATQ